MDTPFGSNLAQPGCLMIWPSERVSIPVAPNIGVWMPVSLRPSNSLDARNVS